MSKKRNSKVLAEAQVRRMMGLAGIPAVNESDFMDRYRTSYLEQEEEEAPVEDPAAELPAEEEPAAVEGEPAAMEPDAPADEANVETLVQALAQTITDVTGVPVDGGEGGGEELPAEDPMAAPAAEDPMAAEPAAEEPPAEEPALQEETEANLAAALAAAGIQLELDNDELVAEITKRVAARLVRESRKSKRTRK